MSEKKVVITLAIIAVYSLLFITILFCIGDFIYVRYTSFFELYSACFLILLFYWNFNKTKQNRTITVILGLLCIFSSFVLTSPAIFGQQHINFTSTMDKIISIFYIVYHILLNFIANILLSFSIYILKKKKEPIGLLMALLLRRSYKKQ